MATTRRRSPRRATTTKRRTSTATRSSSSPRRTTTARPAAGAPTPARGTSRPGAPQRRKPDLITSALGSVYGGVALATGTFARAPRTPDVQVNQRRDKGGLAALIVAVVLAGVTWSPTGPGPLAAVRELTFDVGGGLAGVLPVIALLVAWRLFRHPHRPRRTGQYLSGVALAYVAALGMAAVVAGLPSLPHGGLAAVRPAGGLPGWLVTATLGHFGGIWLAGAASAIAFLGGLRLMLGFPFREIPAALTALAMPGGLVREVELADEDLADDEDADHDDDEAAETARTAGRRSEWYRRNIEGKNADPAADEDDEEADDVVDQPVAIDAVDAVPFASPDASDRAADALGTAAAAPLAPSAASLSPAPAATAAAATIVPARAAGLPSLDLLGHGSTHRSKSRENDAMKAALQDTLGQYGVDATVETYTRGPAITRYEIVPGNAVRVKKITGLADEFKLAAKSEAVRVLPVIDGKSAIGVEIPNETREIVSLGDVLRASVAAGNPSPLLLGLGRDIEGRTIVAELARLLHILVAGATGGGKSGVLNDLIVSLLLRNSPDELRFLLIDPKQVEFSLYRGLPHLWRKIVTDPEEASTALDSVCMEMDSRYSLMSSHGAKNIDTFNANARAGRITGPDGTPLKPLPRLVVVIDELADLMALNKDGVEKAIQRITQLGRAAGIHLITATQRPSVDVVTGVIKANIPTRIALETASLADSRVILDMAGAELLTGQGDALYVPAGTSKATRIQSGWVTDSEIQAVVRHWINWAKQPVAASA
jgi:DNA segregation ATPase FtsK/SpoIIIE, S-DNA-T family